MKMFRVLVVFLLPMFLTEAIIAPEDEVTKPPKHRENLQWPSDHPNYVAPRAQTILKDQPSENYRDIVLVRTAQGSRPTDVLCPDKATGQFTYIPDCRKFINCWKGRGFIQACAPGTLFNPRSLECDFPAKVKCLPYEEGGKSEAIREEEGAENIEKIDYVGKGMIDVRFGTEFESPPSSSSSSVQHFPVSSFVPNGQSSSRHNTMSRSYPNSNVQNSKPISNRPPTPTRVYPSNPNRYPSSPSPWLQPPLPSNPPQRHQGRFPPRQPHSLKPSGSGNPHLIRPPSPRPPGYNPSYSPPQSPRTQQQYPQSSGNPHLTHPPSPHPHGYNISYSPPQSPGTQHYLQSHSQGQSSLSHQQYPRPYTPYFGHSEQIPGHAQQHSGYNPGNYPQSTNTQPQFRNYHTQHSGDSHPGSHQQYHGNQQQYPGSLSEPQHSNQQYSGIHPATSRNEPSSTQHALTTEALHGRDVSTIHNKLECSMPGGTGLALHPTDCRKYLDCWKGTPHTQFCAPGTLFNPALLQCDHPYNVDCKKSTNSQDPGKKWVPPKESTHSTTPPGYNGLYPSSPTEFGSNPSNQPGYGLNPPNQPGYGSNSPNPPGYGLNPSNQPGYGSNPSNPPGYGFNPSNQPEYGSYPSNLPGYGTNPYNQPGYGSDSFNPTGLSPDSYSAVGFGSVDRSNPPFPTAFSSNVPPHPTSRSPSVYIPTAIEHTDNSDFLPQESHGFHPDSSHSHSQTIPSIKNTTPQTLTTKESSLTAEASETRTYYVPGSGSRQPEDGSLWVPESHSVGQQSSPPPAVASSPLPRPVTSEPPRTVYSTAAATTKRPTNIMSISNSSSSQSKPSWKPSNTTKPVVGYSPILMTSGQVLRLRGGKGPFDGYVEVQGTTPGWGLVCDENGGWNIDEATVVCKQLGYIRGAELSWQGRPVRPTDDTIHISVSEVRCLGDEEDFFSCRMTRGAGHCLIPRDAIGVRCYRNFVSVCQEGEINHGGKCYSVIVPKEDTALEAFSHGEALADCQKRKGKLIDITSQAESDFISELLLQSYPHINSIITSGVGVKVMGHPLWIWEGSGESFKFQKWWPGWTGNETAPTATMSGDRMQCVVAKRVFPCQGPYLPDIVGLANLCEANYFYWATEDCSVTHDHPYVCERPQDDVGCVLDVGQDYMGTANISSTGSACLPWDSPLTPAALKYRMAYKVRQRTMVGHNYCRNVAGGETHPWCYVGPEAQFQYCDIPECPNTEDTPTSISVSNTNKCGIQEFECSPGECIVSTLVCDKKLDCSNGKDEEECPDTFVCGSDEFQCRAKEVITASLVCDGKIDCSNRRDEQNCTGVKTSKGGPISAVGEFVCHPNECILSSRVCDGVQDCADGKDEKDCRVADNNLDDTSNCSMKEFECMPGRCIPSVWVCDGVADCSNEKDEQNCPDVEKAVRDGLKCGPKEFECRPGECVLLTWVCDGAKDCSNGRDEKDCSGLLGQFSKHLNRRLVKHDKQKWLESDAAMCAEHCINAKDFICRSFSHLPKDRICVLSDSNVGLSGDLNQTAEWQYYERRSTSLQCDNLFHCDNGKCVNRSMVCDGKNNCGDRTDERNCSAEYLDYEIRLAGGNSSNEGRVEVKVYGQWGAICDDLFGPRDAEVVCRELNFTLGAAEVVGQSMFGGTSPKFLVDDLQCRGDETSIRECDFDGWGVHDCGPEEAVGVVCRIPGVDCKVNYWRCDKSSECIPIGFLCDNVPDCEDGSDESAAHCEAPVELRLVGGPSNMSGRVEVRYNGVWGSVCDDDFTDTAAQVICRMLGFGGPAEAKKDAAFGPGEGQIWLDQLHCTGKETHIEDCIHSQWGENNCAHEEDASVVCSMGEVPKHMSEKNKPKVVAIMAASPDVTANQILPAHCGLKSDEYWEMATHSDDRVLGGNEVAQGSFPWQASLRVRTAGKSVHWCGAVVLSPLHILTAGHCLQDYTKGAYLIRVGDHDTEANDGTEQEASIDEIYLHEEFNKGPRLTNDIALIKLKSVGIRLGPSVQPICLPPSNARYHSGLNCSISGWGTIKAGGTGYARKLRAAWVSVIPDDVCRADYVYGSKAITEGMICAGDLEGKADSCQGDSGGPLICLNNGRFTLYGITSWGHGCGRPNRPGVYSQVGHFRSWIDQKLKASMTGK